MKSTYTRFLSLIPVAALAVTGTAEAAVIVDAYLTDTSQIRSASNNPIFGAGLTQNVAAVNLTWFSTLNMNTTVDREAAHGALAGGTLNGIAFHDILLGQSFSATGVTVGNAIAGVTMDYTLEGSINRNFVAGSYTGIDAAVLYNISATNPSRNVGASVTFHGLTPNNNVYIQLIGSNFWGTPVDVTLNGGTPVDWTSQLLGVDPGNPPGAADGSRNSSLLGITTTADGNGDLTIDVIATGGNNYYGFGAITVAQAIPEPTAALLGGLGMLAMLRRRKR